MLGRRGGASWAYLLLLVPVVAVIFPPLYAHHDPTLSGVPFYVWYQLLWTVVGALFVAAVYLIQGGGDEEPASPDRPDSKDRLSPP
jgi:hypothetical protein